MSVTGDMTAMGPRIVAGALTVIAIIAVGLSVARTQSVSERLDPADFAAIRYEARDADVRTLRVRVSRWNTAGRAEEFGQSLLAGARSDLPDGEFYQTDAVDVPVPEDSLAPPAGARNWRTFVGAAGFTTEWLVLVVLRDTLVWDFRISGRKDISLLEVALSLAADLINRERGDGLSALLPAAEDVPHGMVVEYTMSPAD